MARCASAKAPAKVILFGEHFVVEGKPAIVAAVDLYARVKAFDIRSSIVEAYSKNLSARGIVWPECSDSKLCFIGEIIKGVGIELGRIWPARLIIDSEIPMGSGMGSSASVSVAATAAYLGLASLRPSPSILERIALYGERLIHGKPSGVDVAIAVHGGVLFFRRDKGVLRKLTPRLDGVVLIVADSGIVRNTGIAVKLVLERKKRLGKIGDNVYSLAEEIVMEAMKALESGDVTRLGELMDLNHGLLNAMGVSTPELERLAYEARKAGALGAKITGAGLGGSIIALAEEDKAENIVKALKRYAVRAYILNPGAKGVVVEEEC
ncbi:MAG: mevalonate kinase [Pyrodictiaceae archaeon]